MRWMPILDPAVPQMTSDAVYLSGHSIDAFVMTSDGGEVFTGNWWPGEVAYPDFFADGTSDWWQMWMNTLYQDV